ncbi:peptidase S8/S53 domain-containing protein [Xylariales sp. AK1849]|nr:peptidase S8/S53 domain-containing protein [Xylariales sp. AK1849]
MRLSIKVSVACAALLGVADIVACRPAPGHVVHEKREMAPEQWTMIAPASADTPLDLRIALKESNLEHAEGFLLEVSHPKSVKYGQFWTPQQVIAAFMPSEEAVLHTTNWLLQSNVEAWRMAPSPGRNWIKVNSTVGEAERLLDTTYNLYQNDEGMVMVACESYSVPAEIQPYIEFVSPTIQFDTRSGTIGKRVEHRDTIIPKVQEAVSVEDPDSLANCSQITTPACLRALYNLPEEGEVVEGNSYGIVEFSPQSFNQTDLNVFYSMYAKNVPNNTAPIVVGIDGGVLVTSEGSTLRGESNLDLCYAIGLVHPQDVTLFQVGDDVGSDPATNNNFLDALDGSYCTFEGGDNSDWDATYPHEKSANTPNAYEGEPMCGTDNATYVISVSYGRNEGDRPNSYTDRECREWLKLGLMGVTAVFASGDSGVAGINGQCLQDNGAPAPVGASYGHFNPGKSITDMKVVFPASCPWITSVGGSALPENGTIGDKEVMPWEFSPGGGFSNLFGLPEYQAAAVAAYYADHDPGYNSSRYNNTQQVRGYPDVAVASQNFITSIDGGFQAFTGTSAAAPTFGSMIALINGERIKAGKGTVGFVNPVLYEHPEIFSDITQGHSNGCGTDGFAAVEGWDPASGLGAPDFVKLRDALLNLP